MKWNTQLYYYIENAQIAEAIKEIRKMPTEELNIGYTDEAGWSTTHLYHAINKGLTVIAQILIDKGCHIGVGHSSNEKSVSHLYMACTRGNLNIVNMLIEKGCDLNAGVKYRSHCEYTSCLYKAFSRNFYGIAELLIQAGADVNYGTRILYDGSEHHLVYSPLYAALNSDNNECDFTQHKMHPAVYSLVQKGADINKVIQSQTHNMNYKFHSAICEAIMTNNLTMALYLIKHYRERIDLAVLHRSTNVVISNEDTDSFIKDSEPAQDCDFRLRQETTTVVNALLLSIEYESEYLFCQRELIKLLLELGMDVNSSIDNVTPLEQSVKNGSTVIFNLLLDKGANITNHENQQLNSQGEIVLYEAAKHGHLDMVKRIFEIANIVDIDMKLALDRADLQQGPLLMLAACYGHDQIVDFAISKGANVNFGEDFPGVGGRTFKTALEVVAEKGYVGIFKKLIEAGAHFFDKQGALSRFERYSLTNQGVRALQQMIWHSRVEILSYVLDQKIDLGQVSHKIQPIGGSVLAVLVGDSQRKSVIIKALEKGAWCNYRWQWQAASGDLILKTALQQTYKITDIALRSEIEATLALGIPRAKLIGDTPNLFPNINTAIGAYFDSPLYKGLHYILKPRTKQIKSYWHVMMLAKQRLNTKDTVKQLPKLSSEIWILILKSAYAHIFSFKESDNDSGLYQTDSLGATAADLLPSGLLMPFNKVIIPHLKVCFKQSPVFGYTLAPK